MKSNTVRKVVISTIESFNKTNTEGVFVDINLKTRLTGSNTSLDSIALINLLLQLEKNVLKIFKKKITIVDQDVLQDKKILNSIKNLIVHIEKKISE